MISIITAPTRRCGSCSTPTPTTPPASVLSGCSAVRILRGTVEIRFPLDQGSPTRPGNGVRRRPPTHQVAATQESLATIRDIAAETLPPRAPTSPMGSFTTIAAPRERTRRRSSGCQHPRCFSTTRTLMEALRQGATLDEDGVAVPGPTTRTSMIRRGVTSSSDAAPASRPAADDSFSTPPCAPRTLLGVAGRTRRSGHARRVHVVDAGCLVQQFGAGPLVPQQQIPDPVVLQQLLTAQHYERFRLVVLVPARGSTEAPKCPYPPDRRCGQWGAGRVDRRPDDPAAAADHRRPARPPARIRPGGRGLA